jgi:predicted amidohydrolase
VTGNERLRVGIAQIDCDLGDLRANADRHLEYIDRARSLGVELLLFPELSLTGYRLGEDILRVALGRDDPLVLELAEAAGDMSVVLGLVEEGPAAQFYNSALTLRGGRVVFEHRKLNVPTYGNLEEGKLFAQGSYVEVLRGVKPWTLSTLICADLWNPALVHLAMVNGATLLLAPINSARDASEFSTPASWKLAVDFYAMMYGMPVMMANRVGEEYGARFWGESRILDAYGNTVAAAGNEPELITAELNYDDVRRARFALPTVRDSNLDLVRREIDRLSRQVGVPEFVRRD